jgi:hypothetical protein
MWDCLLHQNGKKVGGWGDTSIRCAGGGSAQQQRAPLPSRSLARREHRGAQLARRVIIALAAAVRRLADFCRGGEEARALEEAVRGDRALRAAERRLVDELREGEGELAEELARFRRRHGLTRRRKRGCPRREGDAARARARGGEAREDGAEELRRDGHRGERRAERGVGAEGRALDRARRRR